MATHGTNSKYHENDPAYTNAAQIDSDVEMETENREEQEHDNEEGDEEGSNIDIEADGDGERDEEDVESEDEEEEDAGDEEEERDEEIQSDADEPTTPSVTTPKASGSRLKIRLKMPAQPSSRYETPMVESEDSLSNDSQPSVSRPMTTRQAVLASVLDSSHVSLAGSRQKKAPLNENELALRREETARKRKNLSEKKLEDEKAETINRLLKKQSRPRNKRTTAQRDHMDDVAPPGSLARTRSDSNSNSAYNPPGRKKVVKKPAAAEDQDDGDDEDGMGAAEDNEEEEQPEREEPTPTMYRWLSTSRIPASQGEAATDVQMQITFSVPVSVLPPSGTTDVVVDEKSHASERPRGCAAPGCGKPFRYRLVKDWTQGACGIACLKLLEASAIPTT
ncbi:hypothetical protein FPV67DRAFT_1494794 [Lyophyllum atratum]|nr:hypothetical protein FPV67DRAFT_1494794 [Lyophyllum atratum]